MKNVRVGFLSALLIAVLAAFATPKPNVTYHKKLIDTSNCQSTSCTPTVTTACSETDMQYFQSNANGSIPCNTQRVLYNP
ncbi:MAG: hypothetical protein JNK79_03165 [Chitinophagaceae bacterium]|nr:hypothetical protein [Chitinophagaceae bacterium]